MCLYLSSEGTLADWDNFRYIWHQEDTVFSRSYKDRNKVLNLWLKDKSNEEYKKNTGKKHNCAENNNKLKLEKK